MLVKGKKKLNALQAVYLYIYKFWYTKYIYIKPPCSLNPHDIPSDAQKSNSPFHPVVTEDQFHIFKEKIKGSLKAEK